MLLTQPCCCPCVQRKWRARMRANKLRRYYQWRTSRHVEVPYEGLLADKARLLQQIAAMQVSGWSTQEAVAAWLPGAAQGLC